MCCVMNNTKASRAGSFHQVAPAAPPHPKFPFGETRPPAPIPAPSGWVTPGGEIRERTAGGLGLENANRTATEQPRAKRTKSRAVETSLRRRTAERAVAGRRWQRRGRKGEDLPGSSSSWWSARGVTRRHPKTRIIRTAPKKLVSNWAFAWSIGTSSTAAGQVSGGADKDVDPSRPGVPTQSRTDWSEVTSRVAIRTPGGPDAAAPTPRLVPQTSNPSRASRSATARPMPVEPP